MKLSYEIHDAIAVVTISGELTVDQAETFRRTCLDRFEDGVRDIVLNMEYLTLLDSAGLEGLLWLTDETADRQGSIRLVTPDSTIEKILEVTRLDRRFDTHESIESAAKSLRKRSREDDSGPRHNQQA